MKKTILILLLAVPLFGQSYLISTDYDMGSFISDSLYFDWISEDDDTTSGVTYKQFDNKFRYSWAVITLIDTGATYDDSLRIQYSDPSGVNWSDFHFLKDSTWKTVTQPIADDNSVKSYMAYIEPYWKFRVYMTNTVEVENLVHYFKIQLLRNKPQF